MKMRNLSKVMTTLGITSFAVSAFAQQAAPAMAPQAAPTTAPQAVPAVAAQAMAPVGLNQVVERAITSHPEINARYQDFVSTLEDQNIARAGWRPSITAQAWTGREWRSNIENAPSYDWNRPGWNVELRQLIFDGGATSNRIRQFGFEKLSKYYDLHATSNNLANEAVAAYLDVQRYRSMQALAQENFSMHAATLGQLRERQESGVGRGVDKIGRAHV